MAEAQRRERVSRIVARSPGWLAAALCVLTAATSCAPRQLEVPLERGSAVERVVSGEPRSPAAIHTAFQGGFGPDAETTLPWVARRHGLWVLSGGPSKAARLRELNPAGLVLRYTKIGGLHGPETRPPTGDPDWAEIERRDLVARDERGAPVRNTENGWFYVDLLDPARRGAWIEVLVARLAVDLEGYDGVMLDNSGVVHESLMSARPAGYDDAAYFDAVHEVLRAVRAALPGKTIVFNSYGGFAAERLRGPALLDVADGIYFEGFSFKVTGTHFASRRLVQQLTDFAAAARSGKITVALDYVDAADVERRTFSLASFLLAAGERSYHFVSAPRIASAVQEYPEQALDLGRALDAMRARTDGLLSRRYERGWVLLNPEDQPAVFELAGKGRAERLRLEGGGAFPSPGALVWEASARRIELAPHSGAIVR